MKAKVIESIQASPSVVILRFKPEQPLEFKAGQFVSILVEKDGKRAMKAYSITSSPHIKEYFELCIKVVENGMGSNYLAELKVDDEIEFKGPFGHFLLQEEISNELIFIATGTGISALKPLISEAFNKGTSHDVWLFFGVRTEKDLIYKKDFEAQDVSEIAGKGLKGIVNGKTVLVGNKALMTANNIDVPTETESIVESIVLVAIENQFAGYVVIADELKEDAKETITALHKVGIKNIMMLSGDKDSITQQVAKELNIENAMMLLQKKKCY